MEHFLYRLNFSTALHIGKDTGGPSLDDGQMIIHADTLFSALCCEAVHGGRITQLVKYFADGILSISDALPYVGDEIFLPRPVLFTENRKRAGDSALAKALKNKDYIPLSFFGDYLKSMQQLDFNLESLKSESDFGYLTTLTRVAIKGNSPPLPYHVAAWRFADGCGLYIIVRSEREEARTIFESLLAELGLSGIGGKQSSGWGKFKVEPGPLPDELLKLLEDKQAKYQMLMGTALPVDSELDTVLPGGWYKLLRRGGFIRSENYAHRQMKKRTIYMLAPGSCLRSRFKGAMFDLSDNGAHPVWRCGNTLFVGVTI
jgi:CRISPR-associated protein Csm4